MVANLFESEMDKEILNLAEESGIWISISAQINKERGHVAANPVALEAFYRAAYNKAIEDAAKVCACKADEVRDEGVTSQALGFMLQDYEECAAAIRALELK